jgi:hypothetical protein
MGLRLIRGRLTGVKAVLPGLACMALLGACGGVEPGHPHVTPALPKKASATTTQPASAATSTGAADLTPRALEAALATAVQATGEQDGKVQVAVLDDGWTKPLLLGQDLHSQMRLWSLSKAVVATALLRETYARGEQASALEPYLERALTRSDNCAMRELTLDLQRDTGGLGGARNAISAVLARAGASIDFTRLQSDQEGAVCLTSGYPDLTPAYTHRSALLLGTATWRIDDAVLFMRALDAGLENPSGRPYPGSEVLAMMGREKQPSREPLAGTLTAPPSWGAGDVFRAACWHLAYKAGWGGAQAHIPWLGAQMGAVSLPGGARLSFAVAVHPFAQPIDDDPGHTVAPQGISRVLRALRGALLQVGACA